MKKLSESSTILIRQRFQCSVLNRVCSSLSGGSLHITRTVPLSGGSLQITRTVPLNGGSLQITRTVPLSGGSLHITRTVPLINQNANVYDSNKRSAKPKFSSFFG